MATEIEDSVRKWEEAFIRFGFDAAVGRLFRGIIHNLNGVGQAFSMQSELFNMMFEQSSRMIAEIQLVTTLEEAREKTAKLGEMLERRAELARHLAGAVKILLETMERASILAEEDNDSGAKNPVSLNSVVKTEVEFLNSDGFFKHKIKKELSLASDIPDLTGNRVEIHQIVGILLENAAKTLAENIAQMPEPEIAIVTSTDGDSAKVMVIDNGPGIAVAVQENIFAPFISTRKDHLGLGLYLAKVMAGKIGGQLTFASTFGRTCFTLILPMPGGQA